MKFNKFLNIYKNIPIIDSTTFSLYSKDPANLRRQVRDWVKKGYLLPLKRGLYVFGESYSQGKTSNLFIANYLVSPSYVGLEYALSFYGLIPEKVGIITSVTSKKTAHFSNALGDFQYRSVKPKLFFGFRKIEDMGQNVFIAQPEKALLDYFYLNSSEFKGNREEFESMRLQNVEEIDIQKIEDFKKLYGRKMARIIDALVEYIADYVVRYKKL